MATEVMFGITVVVVTVAIFVHVRNTRRLTTLYGEELHAYNTTAFKEVTEDSPEEHFIYVTKLATEVASTRGQKAILVGTSENGTAIHHINQDGTFSAKGPYFISWRSGNWHRTGKTHLVKVLRGKGSWGMAPDHYNQGGSSMREDWLFLSIIRLNIRHSTFVNSLTRKLVVWHGNKLHA
jgi:hypothetical protein